MLTRNDYSNETKRQRASSCDTRGKEFRLVHVCQRRFRSESKVLRPAVHVATATIASVVPVLLPVDTAWLLTPLPSPATSSLAAVCTEAKPQKGMRAMLSPVACWHVLCAAGHCYAATSIFSPPSATCNGVHCATCHPILSVPGWLPPCPPCWPLLRWALARHRRRERGRRGRGGSSDAWRCF